MQASRFKFDKVQSHTIKPIRENITECRQIEDFVEVNLYFSKFETPLYKNETGIQMNKR